MFKSTLAAIGYTVDFDDNGVRWQPQNPEMQSR